MLFTKSIVDIEKLSRNIKNYLDIKEINFHYPQLKFLSESEKRYRYIIAKILYNLKENKANEYINNQRFLIELYDSKTKNYIKKDIFVKKELILNSILYAKNGYNIERNLLPDKDYKNKFQKKISYINNSTYVDSFFYFLANKLLEDQKCIHFPQYYGACNGISHFYFDATQDIDYLKFKTAFRKNKNSLFELLKVKNIVHSKKYRVTSITNKSDDSSSDSLDSSSEDSNIDDCLDNFKIILDEEQFLEKDATSPKLRAKSSNENIEIKDETEEKVEIKDEIEKEVDINDETENEVDDRAESLSSDNENNIKCIKIDSSSINKISLSDVNKILRKNQKKSKNSNSPTNSYNSSHNSESSNSSSSSSSSESSMSNSSDDGVYFNEYYLKFNMVPSQFTFMENLDGTLENIIDDDKFSSEILLSILFQICFTLALLQKEYKFTHNDLHTRNVMYKKSNIKYLYYKCNEIYYKVPTFKKIIKIIDFGRSIYTYKKHIYFNDVYNKDGDASGQYTYPSLYKKKSSIVKPNYNFDLSRLSVSILEDCNIHLEKDLYKLLKKWVSYKKNKDVRNYKEFDLYKAIARKIQNANPSEEIFNEIFSKYIIEKDKIPKKKKIYNIEIDNIKINKLEI